MLHKGHIQLKYNILVRKWYNTNCKVKHIYVSMPTMLYVKMYSHRPWNTHLDNTQVLQIKFEWKWRCLDANVTNRALYKAQKDLIPLAGNTWHSKETAMQQISKFNHYNTFYPMLLKVRSIANVLFHFNENAQPFYCLKRRAARLMCQNYPFCQRTIWVRYTWFRGLAGD